MIKQFKPGFNNYQSNASCYLSTWLLNFSVSLVLPISEEDDELDDKLCIRPITSMGSSCHESPLPPALEQKKTSPDEEGQFQLSN